MARKSSLSFRIKRPKGSKQFHCVVRNEGNHEITLTGEPCKNQKDVHDMIEAHIAAVLEGRYSIIIEDGVVSNGKPVKKKRSGAGRTKATS